MSKASSVLETVKEARGALATLGTVITAAVAFMSSPNWPLAALITLIGIAGATGFVIIGRHIDKQDRDIEACRGEKEANAQERNECNVKLARRDVLIAALLMEPKAKKQKGRRKDDNTLIEMVLGQEDGKKARQDALAILERLV